MREDPAHTQEVQAIMVMTASVQECTFIVVFGSLLFCARECCADLRIVVILERIGPYVEKYMRFF